LAYVQANMEVLCGHLPGLLAGEAARDEQLGDETKQMVEDSRKGIERISTALSALRILLRDDSSHPPRGDVRRAADAASRLLQMRLPSSVQLQQSLADTPPVACGDGL